MYQRGAFVDTGTQRDPAAAPLYLEVLAIYCGCAGAARERLHTGARGRSSSRACERILRFLLRRGALHGRGVASAEKHWEQAQAFDVYREASYLQSRRLFYSLGLLRALRAPERKFNNHARNALHDATGVRAERRERAAQCVCRARRTKPLLQIARRDASCNSRG